MTTTHRAVWLRSATPEDAGFLFDLYCDTRRQELAAWGWPPQQQAAFLRFQFDACSRAYAAQFPAAEDRIVCLGAEAAPEPVGRILTAIGPARMCLIDIAILSAYRNRGIGASLIGALAARCDAEDRVLSLQVLAGNPAARLYRRLGFRERARDPMYIQMERVPG